MDPVIYHASAGVSTLEIIQLLRSHGLSPRALDPSNPIPLRHFTGVRGSYVRIAVPAEEVARAIEVLKVWDAQNAALVKRTTAELRRDVLFAFGLVLVAAASIEAVRMAMGSTITLADLVFAVPVVAASTAVGTVVLANLRAAQQRRHAAEGPRCPNCDYSLLGLTLPRCPECGHPFDPELEDRAARLDR